KRHRSIIIAVEPDVRAWHPFLCSHFCEQFSRGILFSRLASPDFIDCRQLKARLGQRICQASRSSLSLPRARRPALAEPGKNDKARASTEMIDREVGQRRGGASHE